MSEPLVYENSGDIFSSPIAIDPTNGKFGPAEVAADLWSVSKIQIVEYPYALPSRCACCGSVPNPELPNKRYFIDFGLSLDSFGQVYFCSDCFIEAAKKLGYLGPIQTKLAATERDSLTLEVVKLRSENESFRNALGALALLNQSSDSISNSGVDHPTESNESVTDQPGINSSVNEPRSNDISSTTSNDKSDLSI